MRGKHISVASQEAMSLIEDRRDGIVKPLATQWKRLNKALQGGFEWGTMTTIGGMSGAGKTAFVAQLYRHLCELNPTQKFIIVFFTFEMTAAKLMLRDIIAATQIHREDLLSTLDRQITPQQVTSVQKFLDGIKDLPIYFEEQSVTPEEYIEICRWYYEKYGVKVVAIGDHSLLFEGENMDNDRGMLVRLAKKIMQLKREEWSMHILLSQLNRDIEQAARRVPCSPLNFPDKSCLFASDALYQASDYVIFLHRPYRLKFQGNTYGPENWPCGEDDVYIHIDKQREGNTYILPMKADFKNMQILE